MSAETTIAFRRLCRILSPFSDAQEVAAALPPEPGWRGLIAMADAQYVLPELHPVLFGHNLLGRVPPTIAEMLEAYFDIAVGRNTELRAQVAEVTAMLGREGIVPVWLKGAIGLTHDGWERRGRVMGDLDLWIVDPDAQLRALEVFEATGYHRHPGHEEDTWARMHHYAPRHHPERPAKVEIHRHLVRPKLASLLPDRDVAARLVSRQWSGHAMAEPCLEDRIMHSFVQCTFMATPRFESAQPRLMKHLDLARLVAAYGGNELPAAVMARVARPRWRRTARRFLTHAEVELGLANPLPPDAWLCERIAYRLDHDRLPLIDRCRNYTRARILRLLGRTGPAPAPRNG